MGKYGQVAIIATESIQHGIYSSPREAWNAAASQVFSAKSSKNKGCPRGAYLGLCEAGSIKGIPVGKYGNSVKNKAYALKALDILTNQPHAVYTEKSLWVEVLDNEDMAANHQMDVVLSLWNGGFFQAEFGRNHLPNLKRL